MFFFRLSQTNLDRLEEEQGEGDKRHPPLRSRRTQSWCCASIPLRNLLVKVTHID